MNILRASYVYRALAAVWAWFGLQWRSSRVISAFLRPGMGEAMSRSSIFYRVFEKLHALLCAVFEKMHLTKLLEGSIFKNSFLWSFLAVFFAPILPTAAAIALAVVSFGSLVLQFACDRNKKLAYAPVNKYIILFALVYLVSIVMSVRPAASFGAGLVMGLFILFAIVLQNAVNTEKQFNAVIYGMIIAGVIVCAYGFYQYVFNIVGTTAWWDEDKFTSISMRVYSTLGNPNVLAEYLLLIIPFSAAAFFTQKSHAGRWLVLFAGGAMVLCMVLTMSRGGWLGLLVAAALFLVLLDRRFIILGMVGLIALYFVLPDSIISRFASIGDMSDTSTSYRVSIWMGALLMLKDYWYCGIGPGAAAFNGVYPIYSYNAASAQHAHNLYLQITCDTGVSGIVVFVMFMFSYFRMLASAISRTREKAARMYQIAAMSSAAGFFVQALTDHAFYNYRVVLMFWTVVAIGAIASRAAGRGESADD